MNFLSHYYCDGKPGDAYYNLGLAIPDMMSMFKRGWKINEKFSNEITTPKLQSIAQGVRRHFQADQFFHQSDFFLRNTSRIKKIMMDVQINYRGTHFLFLSHILLEICIDRLIVISLPAVTEGFYKDISAVDKNNIEAFFHKINLPIPDGFFVFFDRFVNDKFLYAYSDIEKIIFMYNRILTRVNMTVLDPAEFDKLSYVISSTDDFLLKELPDKGAFLQLTT